MVVTAGDLIRRELEAGSSELGLAKRLAGSAKDDEPEVKRWRYVVRRAGKGSEPDNGNITRIVELLADPGETIERRGRGQHHLDRLEALAEAVDEIQANQHKALLEQERMLGELREIRAALETARTGRRAAPKRKAR